MNQINAAMALGMWRPLVSDARPPPPTYMLLMYMYTQQKEKASGVIGARRYQTEAALSTSRKSASGPTWKKLTQPALMYQLHPGELCENDDLCFGTC